MSWNSLCPRCGKKVVYDGVDWIYYGKVYCSSDCVTGK